MSSALQEHVQMKLKTLCSIKLFLKGPEELGYILVQ